MKPYLSPRRWRRLGWSRAPILAEVVIANRLYRRLEPEPLPEMLEAMTDASARPPVDPTQLVEVVDWFLHPKHGPDRCMPRTVILLRMLARRGYDAVAVFGVSKTDDALQGHAWIELDDEPFAEHEDPRPKYAETYRYSGALS